MSIHCELVGDEIEGRPSPALAGPEPWEADLFPVFAALPVLALLEVVKEIREGFVPVGKGLFRRTLGCFQHEGKGRSLDSVKLGFQDRKD